MKIFLSLLCGWVFLASGCSRPHEEKQGPFVNRLELAYVALETATFSTGDTVSIGLQNQTDSTQLYGRDCSMTLERQVASDRWIIVVPSGNVFCNDIAYRLEARSARTVDAGLPQDLPPGTYRLRPKPGVPFQWVTLPFRVR